MTVDELIEELRVFDPDTRVLVDGYEDGCDEPKVRTERVCHEPDGGWWSGDWQEVKPYEKDRYQNSETAVVVGR